MKNIALDKSSNPLSPNLSPAQYPLYGTVSGDWPNTGLTYTVNNPPLLSSPLLSIPLLSYQKLPEIVNCNYWYITLHYTTLHYSTVHYTTLH